MIAYAREDLSQSSEAVAVAYLMASKTPLHTRSSSYLIFLIDKTQ